MRSVLILALALATPAFANVGRGYSEGARTGEPTGLRAIAIDREQLAFDLRPLATGHAARVTATYHLVNAGDAVNAPLVFVSGIEGVEGFEVTFDGQALSGDSPKALSDAELAALPASWAPPRTTPAIDGGERYYSPHRAASFAFTLAIPPGTHTLAVSYGAIAQRNRSTDGGTIVWQLGYVLAPARDWGRFGTLDVSIDVPPGWLVATTPALARTGDTLRATFGALPADAIGITTQAPTGTLHDILQVGAPLLLALVIFGGIALLVVLRRRIASRSLALLLAVSWAVAIGATGAFTALRGDMALPQGQAALYGYGPGFGVVGSVLGALVAIVVGYFIARPRTVL